MCLYPKHRGSVFLCKQKWYHSKGWSVRIKPSPGAHLLSKQCLLCCGHLVPCCWDWVSLCLGTASWNSAMAPLCSPVSSFSLCDAGTAAGSESRGVTQSPSAHASVVCQTWQWWRSAAATCQRANQPKRVLILKAPGGPLAASSPGRAASLANVVSYLLACILMEFFNHTNWLW